MTLRDKGVVFLASGFGIGYVPLIPGTFGTLPALPLCYLLSKMPAVLAVGAVIAIIGVSMWIAGEAEKSLQQKDPRKIVIDEIAGMTVALAGLPFDAATVITAFAAFRVFDVWKPFPLRAFEARFSGGFGVVMDDVGAGVYANILARLLMLLSGVLR